MTTAHAPGGGSSLCFGAWLRLVRPDRVRNSEVGGRSTLRKGAALPMARFVRLHRRTLGDGSPVTRVVEA